MRWRPAGTSTARNATLARKQRRRAIVDRHLPSRVVGVHQDDVAWPLEIRLERRRGRAASRRSRTDPTADIRLEDRSLGEHDLARRVEVARRAARAIPAPAGRSAPGRRRRRAGAGPGPGRPGSARGTARAGWPTGVQLLEALRGAWRSPGRRRPCAGSGASSAGGRLVDLHQRVHRVDVVRVAASSHRRRRSPPVPRGRGAWNVAYMRRASSPCQGRTPSGRSTVTNGAVAEQAFGAFGRARSRRRTCAGAAPAAPPRSPAAFQRALPVGAVGLSPRWARARSSSARAATGDRQDGSAPAEPCEHGQQCRHGRQRAADEERAAGTGPAARRGCSDRPPAAPTPKSAERAASTQPAPSAVIASTRRATDRSVHRRSRSRRVGARRRSRGLR